MIIVVFSDSHKDVEPMTEVVSRIKPDMIIHLGDHMSDALILEQQFSDIPVEYVMGNCDSNSRGPIQKLLAIADKRIFITHGDRYRVHNGTAEVLNEGIGQNADVVLFGHTHRPLVKIENDIVLMNPGKIGRWTRGHWQPSYGIIDIDEKINCSTMDYELL